MTQAASRAVKADVSLLPLLLEASDSAEALLAEAAAAVRAKVTEGGKISAAALEREQHAVHGYAWLATYVASVRQLAAYTGRMIEANRFGELEELLVRIGAGEYLAQILGGIPMSQGEMIRLADLGLTDQKISARVTPAIKELIAGNNAEARAGLAKEIAKAQGSLTIGDPGLDETLNAMRAEMHRFAETEVVPHAHEWHLKNEYIPMEIITKMAEMGVFGLTIPEEFGGLGLGKESMCVVSEELSRAWIGVGSLGTRSEIAGELILGGGTEIGRAHV